MGAIVNIIQKSEKAKLTTRRFDGDLSVFVHEKMYTTMPFPKNETTAKNAINIPKIVCHSGSMGGYWYLQNTILAELIANCVLTNLDRRYL